jgi:hypothetical protein
MCIGSHYLGQFPTDIVRTDCVRCGRVEGSLRPLDSSARRGRGLRHRRLDGPRRIAASSRRPFARLLQRRRQAHLCWPWRASSVSAVKMQKIESVVDEPHPALDDRPDDIYGNAIVPDIKEGDSDAEESDEPIPPEPDLDPDPIAELIRILGESSADDRHPRGANEPAVRRSRQHRR